MPGGLLQLVGVGAQNELVNGNPSMTHFRTLYRRHTNFAMEQIRMSFTSSNLELATNGTRMFSCRIDRYAQLLHDCYLMFTLPDIWSPMRQVTDPPSGYDPSSTAIGFEFEWIRNIGYNMIDRIDLTMNGQVIQSLRGEWLKLYSYTTHDANKRDIINQMVGNIPELYDPGNANGRINQYPHAVQGTTGTLPVDASGIPIAPASIIPEPSIRSRQLIVPLHFWFCENPGLSLPLVSLQNAEVYINVTFRNLNDLYTVIDVDETSPTYGERIKPDGDLTYNALKLFLSPPLASGLPSNPTLTNFFPDSYIEGNFIYLTETEMNQLARADQTFLVKTVNHVSKENQFGGNSDVELPMHNLVTRIMFMSPRSDRIAVNDWDNYTNWTNAFVAPWTTMSDDSGTTLYTSGQQQVTSVYPRDPVIDGVLLLDGKERTSIKPQGFYSLLQMYKHVTGKTVLFPCVYMYSFALEHNTYQPSGALNGSMFNKIILRLTLQQPTPLSVTKDGASTSTQVCVLKSTVFSQNPTIIPAAQISLYDPSEVVTVIQTNDNVIFTYTFNLSIYVESINFLRIVSGLGNLVFAS